MTSRSSRAGADGFTLLELLIVLLLIGLIGAAFAGAGRPRSASLSARTAASELASALRLARSQAIATDRPTGLYLDVDRRLYRVGAAAPQALPGRLKLTLVTVKSEVVAGQGGRIRFNPDGSSTGGRIDVEDSSRRLAVRVEWLTGSVSIAELR